MAQGIDQEKLSKRLAEGEQLLESLGDMGQEFEINYETGKVRLSIAYENRFAVN